MSARNDILASVRRALTTVSSPPRPAPPYRCKGELSAEARQARFLSRLDDYNVNLFPIAGEEQIAQTVAARLAALGKRTLAVAPDLEPAWRPEGVDLLVDDAATAYAELNRVEAALTACACAIAETGSLVLDGGPGQGRRALTLLPDHHLCVVFASQIVEIVPEALERMRPSAEAGLPLTFLSGPSATVDIEFDRVVGVHGPRTLDVVFIS